MDPDLDQDLDLDLDPDPDLAPDLDPDLIRLCAQTAAANRLCASATSAPSIAPNSVVRLVKIRLACQL